MHRLETPLLPRTLRHACGRYRKPMSFKWKMHERERNLVWVSLSYCPESLMKASAEGTLEIRKLNQLHRGLRRTQLHVLAEIRLPIPDGHGFLPGRRLRTWRPKCTVGDEPRRNERTHDQCDGEQAIPFH